jgi:hypothetical protein
MISFKAAIAFLSLVYLWLKAATSLSLALLIFPSLAAKFYSSVSKFDSYTSKLAISAFNY